MKAELYEIVTEGTYESLEKLTMNNLEILKGTTPQGNNALHFAARRGHLEMVELLLRLKPCLLSINNVKDETSLHNAAAAGRPLVVNHLLQINPQLKCGCGDHKSDDVEACDSTPVCDVELFFRSVNKDNETALHYAARGGSVDIVIALLEKVEGIEVILNKEGESALYTACDHSQCEVAKVLLNKHPSVSDTRKNGRTCLHVAIDTKQEDLALELLEKRRGLALKTDDSGNTPLHLAILRGSLKVVQKIIKLAPEASFRMNRDEMAPLHIAAQRGCVSSIVFLIKSAPQCIELLGKQNKNALHFAVENGNREVVEFLLQKPHAAAFLLNEPDEEGNTPLLMALEFKKHKVVRKLLNGKVLNTEEITALIGEKMEKKESFKNKILKWFQKLDENSKRDYSRVENVQTLSVVATLIATVSFAAAFAIPGGVDSDRGIPVRMHSASLKAFIISNTIAMCFSMLALLLLLNVSFTFHLLNQHDVSTAAVTLVYWAFLATMVSYSTGMYVLVAPNYLWLASLACVAGCAVPFLEIVWRIVFGIRWTSELIKVIVGLCKDLDYDWIFIASHVNFKWIVSNVEVDREENHRRLQ